ncbi:hypothetical protein CKAH01_00724 [Colletotrichum kahawae]|uniref:Uncharacterized protein n=1 Tax=Colletotrichum kahawae TaxID=34407 RepID=A0AAE0D937_COLKA|nr:hypothetical protein CKAH01_00724 [Colletotrichum kahawae]
MTGRYSALVRLQKAQLISRPTGRETRPANVCHRNQQTPLEHKRIPQISMLRDGTWSRLRTF